MVQKMDLMSELEFYGADTEELWAGKVSEENFPEKRKIGVIGISPKAGASFVTELLKREAKWRDQSRFQWIDLGEAEIELKDVDFLIVVEDGRGFSLEGENNRARMADCLKKLGIPFQMVINRKEHPEDTSGASLYLPVMDFTSVNRLFALLKEYFFETGELH